jgi:hypothetical protein
MEGHTCKRCYSSILQHIITTKMHKTKYRKIRRARPQRGIIEILEKLLSPTAQNHYADLEDTCSDKVTKVGVIVRCTKKVIGKNEGWGQI